MYEGWRLGRSRRRGRDAPAGPGRAAADGAAAVRRGRDRDQPGRPPSWAAAPVAAWRSPATRAAPTDVTARRAAPAAVLAAAAGAHRPPGPGAAPGRATAIAGPYLRDALLDAGVLVETLETATFWSALPRLYDGVTAALRDVTGRPGRAADRRSATSPTSTRPAPRSTSRSPPQPTTPWRTGAPPRRPSSDAIARRRRTITHHHGVGRDHLSWYGREIGEIGVGALAAVKRRLDPQGKINPGVLIPIG